MFFHLVRRISEFTDVVQFDDFDIGTDEMLIKKKLKPLEAHLKSGFTCIYNNNTPTTNTTTTSYTMYLSEKEVITNR